jgi:transposase
VVIETVDPRDTSRTCAECGDCRKTNRKSQAEFVCEACGHRADADVNAARNIRARAISKLAPGLTTVEAKTGNGTAAEVCWKSPGLSRREA